MHARTLSYTNTHAHTRTYTTIRTHTHTQNTHTPACAAGVPGVAPEAATAAARKLARAGGWGGRPTRYAEGGSLRGAATCARYTCAHEQAGYSC